MRKHKTAPSRVCLPEKCWISDSSKKDHKKPPEKLQKKPSGLGRIVFIGTREEEHSEKERKSTKEKEDSFSFLHHIVPSWQLKTAEEQKKEVSYFTTDIGPMIVIRPVKSKQSKKDIETNHYGLFEQSPYSKARDLIGPIPQQLSGLSSVELEFKDASDEEKLGALVGLEMGTYKYLKMKKNGSSHDDLPDLKTSPISKDLLREAEIIGASINIARHLVNTPANELWPESYASLIKDLFKGKKGVTVDIWDEKRQVQENMNLLLGVGMSSPEKPPRLVHIKYRPQGSSKKKATGPISFVGKGITFDTGGLDIKGADGMRLMKKDMAGSAALVGVAYWLINSQFPLNCDFFLALAENTVNSTSFKPGDVLRSRSGLTVEIHNTDAEGRLVLADALDVASSQEGPLKPKAIIDIATLTAAMRVGIGVELAGLICTTDPLAESAIKASHLMGDLVWRMPLFPGYASQLKSTAADLANASSAGSAGGISAALFLQKFTKGLPWLHLDMYAWADRAHGPYAETGSNGQGVQCLISLIKTMDWSNI